MTQTQIVNGATEYKKEIFSKKTGLKLDTITGVIEPTFTDGEFSALVFNEHDIWIEKLFTNEDDAELWVMKQIIKISKELA